MRIIIWDKENEIKDGVIRLKKRHPLHEMVRVFKDFPVIIYSKYTDYEKKMTEKLKADVVFR